MTKTVEIRSIRNDKFSTDKIKARWFLFWYNIKKFLNYVTDTYWYHAKLYFIEQWNTYQFLSKILWVLNAILNGLMVWYTFTYFGNILSYTFLIILVEHYIPWLVGVIKKG